MKQLIVSSSLYGGSAAVLKILGFITFVWLAKILSIDEYAQFGLFYAIQQGVAAFALAGIVESAIGALMNSPTERAREELFVDTCRAFIFVALAVAFFATLLFLWSSNGNASTRRMFFGSLAGGLVLAYASYRSQIVRLEERHLYSLLFNVLPSLGSLLGGAAAVYVYRGIDSFFIGGAIGAAVPLLLLPHDGHMSRGKDSQALRVSRILRTAWPYMIVAVFGWLSGYGNTYVIKAFFHPDDIARFTFALSMCSIMLLMAGGLNQVWSPRFYRLFHVMPFAELESMNRRFFETLAMVLGFVGGIAVIAIPAVLGILGGHLAAYQSLQLELCLLFAAYVVLTSWWQCSNHFLAHGMGSAVLRITLWTSLLGLFVSLLAMWGLGPIGIYVSFLAQMAIRSAGIIWTARKKWAIEIGWSGTALGLFMIAFSYLLSVATSSYTTAAGIYVAATLLVAVVWQRNGRTLQGPSGAAFQYFASS